MGDRRCCCGCWTGSDDFNRADSTDLGDDWDERSGDWEIKSNQLYESGNAGAMVIFQPNHGKPRSIVTVYITDEDTNDIYRVIVNYLDDDNYMYAELDIGTGGVGGSTVSLHSVTGGSDSELISQAVTLTGFPALSRTMNVCLSSEIFSVEVSNISADMCVWYETGPVHSTGYKTGLGNGYGQAIYYDDFTMSEHWEDDPECPDCCPCRCGENEIQKDLIATYVGEDECDTLDGITVELTNSVGWHYWDGVLDDCTGAADADCCGDLIGLEMRLTCGSQDDVTTWTLTLDTSALSGGLGCQACGLTLYADADSTCDPLNLIFKCGPGYPGTSTCPNTCWDCGRQNPSPPGDPETFKTEYVIYVTEAP
jgi:hypothetical protein